jgi:AcrR family transcriptional regulator
MVDVSTQTRRPAHRPSRRSAIVATALELIADSQADAVTIADIAAAANMTPAAIYYHYASRDAILLEGFQEVSRTYRAAIDAGVERVRAGEPIGVIAGEIMTWAKSSPGARAYVLSASGLSSAVEGVLRADRIHAVEQFRAAVRAARPGVKIAEAGVLAVALLSLVEAAVASMLTLDRARKGVSETRFRQEVEALADGIVTATQ